MNQTLMAVFDHISRTPQSSSKILLCMLFSTVFLVFRNGIKHGLSCLTLYMQWLSQTAFIDTTIIMTKLLSKHTLTLSFISSNHSWAFSQYGLFETSHQDIYTTICELWKQGSDQVNIQFFKSILKIGVRTDNTVCIQ